MWRLCGSVGAVDAAAHALAFATSVARRQLLNRNRNSNSNRDDNTTGGDIEAAYERLAGPAADLVTCVVCLDDFDPSHGVSCGAPTPHFLCGGAGGAGCLAGHVRARAEALRATDLLVGLRISGLWPAGGVFTYRSKPPVLPGKTLCGARAHPNHSGSLR
jgi:hypothetical protein